MSRCAVFNSIFLLVVIMILQLSCSRKTSANQVPLGISRATGHAKATRLAGPRITPSHRLEEQEKLKNKVYKQVAWKGRMLEEKLSRKQKQDELDELAQITQLDEEVIEDEDIDVIEETAVGKDSKIRRRPLFKKLLLKRKVSN